MHAVKMERTIIKTDKCMPASEVKVKKCASRKDRCLYKTGKCDNARAWKINFTMHSLCEVQYVLPL